MWTFGTKYSELALILSSLKWLGMSGDHFEGNEPSQIAAHLILAETDSHSVWQLRVPSEPGRNAVQNTVRRTGAGSVR
jgi:hypothetical protein